MSAFARFDPLLQEKIVHNLGWAGLRPVQELAAEAILDGDNCVILAPTAGGKTEASMFPVLSGCLTNQELGLRALYICPTRALLNNQEHRISQYAEMLGLGAFKWHGDVTASDKKKFIKEPCEIILTTPESLEVMLVSGSVPSVTLFRNLKFAVIDEIHALASCDRGSHLLSLLERIRAYCKNDFQRIGLSATVGNPAEILEWLQGSSLNSKRLIVPPKTRSSKSIQIHWSASNESLEKQVLQESRGYKSLLFCESRKLAERISSVLMKTDEPVFVHHSSLSREEREESEKQFHQGKEACIVCTSTMELGIDVGDLDKVMQINTPATVSSFLQRMGRTGRRSNTISNTTFFIEKESFLLQAIALVELARSHWVENVRFSNLNWHILLHQIMAMCLERGVVTKELLWNQLHSAFCFSGIIQDKFYQFIDYLAAKDFLHQEGRQYSMGLKAEESFGRKNFMEIYAVFSAPVEFSVIGLSGDIIGNVEWKFLERLLESESTFSLGGRSWSVVRIEWKKKAVVVQNAPKGKIPQWGGLSPSFLGYEICRKMRDILVSNTRIIYLSNEAEAVLNQLRSDRQVLLAQSFAPIEYDEKGLRWWTYAGGYINTTLRFILKHLLQIDAQATNEFVLLKGEGVSFNGFNNALSQMMENGFWERAEMYNALLSQMPDYRLSKFQPYLPEVLQSRLVANMLLDVEGTKKFLVDFHNR